MLVTSLDKEDNEKKVHTFLKVHLMAIKNSIQLVRDRTQLLGIKDRCGKEIGCKSLQLIKDTCQDQRKQCSES